MITKCSILCELRGDSLRFARQKFLQFTVATGPGVLLTLSGQGASSQTTRTIKIVVPVPAGGGTDFLARLLGEQIGRSHGLTILIENRPGANGIIATEVVARA